MLVSLVEQFNLKNGELIVSTFAMLNLSNNFAFTAGGALYLLNATIHVPDT